VRLFARICFSIAAALGLLSLGVEWRTRQARAKRLRFMPTRPSYLSLVVGLWAGVLAIVGKAAEEVILDVGQGHLPAAAAKAGAPQPASLPIEHPSRRYAATTTSVTSLSSISPIDIPWSARAKRAMKVRIASGLCVQP